MRVGTWTRDLSTKDWIKASSDGRGGCNGDRESSLGGVEGGVGGKFLFVCGRFCSQRMTALAC